MGLLRCILWCAGFASPCIRRCWCEFYYWLLYPISWIKRRTIMENLRVAFPDKNPREIRALANANLRHVILIGIEWCYFFAFPNAVERYLHADEALLAAVKDHRTQDDKTTPIIFCTAHLGNWEVASHISLCTGVPMAAVAAKLSRPFLNRITAIMRANGVPLISAQGAAKGCYKALRKNMDVGILIDQNISLRHGGIFCRFFGLPVTVSPLPAILAMRLKVPILVAGCIRQPDSTFVVEVEPLARDISQCESSDELTQQILFAYERLIMRHPQQYLWMYPRWRAIPANTPEDIRRRYPSYAVPKRYNCHEECFAPAEGASPSTVNYPQE